MQLPHSADVISIRFPGSSGSCFDNRYRYRCSRACGMRCPRAFGQRRRTLATWHMPERGWRSAHQVKDIHKMKPTAAPGKSPVYIHNCQQDERSNCRRPHSCVPSQIRRVQVFFGPLSREAALTYHSAKIALRSPLHPHLRARSNRTPHHFAWRR
jgi:hypothetical protein